MDALARGARRALPDASAVAAAGLRPRSRTSTTTRRCASSPTSTPAEPERRAIGSSGDEPVVVHPLRDRALRRARARAVLARRLRRRALPAVPRRDRRQRDVRRRPLPARHGQGRRPRHCTTGGSCSTSTSPTTRRARTTRGGRARSRRPRTGSTCRSAPASGSSHTSHRGQVRTAPVRRSRRWDSNPRRPLYKSGALPAELLRRAVAILPVQPRACGGRHVEDR